jgi:hypothetical protein
VPTLDEALVAAKAANTTLYVELKRWQDRWKPADLRAISKLVNARHMKSKTYFGGTSGALDALAKTTPGLRTFWRTKNHDNATVAEARKRSVEVVQTTPARVTARSVKALRTAGYVVALQTTNKRPKWRSAYKVGIRVVQTNDPVRYRKWCRSRV